MFRHILFPYDFSVRGRQTVPYVVALARRAAARVTLFAVLPPTFDPVPIEMGGPHLRAGDQPSEWVHHLQQQLEAALPAEFGDVPIERIADGGDAAISIVDFAHTHDVDLIMMPTHGLGRFRTLLIGSVTSKVLHDARRPVWTAAHAETQTASPLPRRVLCAVDGSTAACGIVRWAAKFSDAVGATLHVLHVVGPISDWPSAESERRLQEEVRAEAQGRIAAMLKEARLAVPLHVTTGPIVQTVAQHAREDPTDLVIIGRGAVTEPFGRLRTHAFGIIQQSPCPVLSL